MLLRRASVIALLIVWQTPAFAEAAMACSDLFMRRPVSEMAFPLEELGRGLSGVEGMNRRTWWLNFMTGGVMERATNERLKFDLAEVVFNMEHNLPNEILKDHESLFTDLAISYAYIKLPEPRVLFLREALKNKPETRSEKSELRNYRIELSKLEVLRAKHLKNIGRSYIQARAVLELLEQYRDGATKELSDRAQYVIKHLGLDKKALARSPDLIEFVKEMYTSDVASVLRPEMKQLSALYQGSDANLASHERYFAMNAKLSRDIKMQFIFNQLRRISAVAGDQTITRAAGGMLRKIMIGRKVDGADEAITKLGNSIHKIEIVLSQGGAVEHLKAQLETPQERYKFFRAMCAKFGNNRDVPELPDFMINLARREDMISVYNEIKLWVKEQDAIFKARGENTSGNLPGDRLRETPNITLGEMTFVEAMDKAEKARASGFLPSAVNPLRATTFATVKNALVIATLVGMTSLFYKYFFGDDEDSKGKKDSHGSSSPAATHTSEPSAPAGVTRLPPTSASVSTSGGAPAVSETSLAPPGASSSQPAPVGLVSFLAADGKIQMVERELGRISVMSRDILLTVLKKSETAEQK